MTLVGRRSEPLEEVAALVHERGAAAHVVAADVTAPGAAATVVAAAQEHFGRIDVLVNNAGNVRAGRLEAIEDPRRASCAARVRQRTGRERLVRYRADRYQQDRRGEVQRDLREHLVLLPFYATYAATKAGVAHFGEALRRELYGEGVHVLNVFRGATSTPMMETSKAGPEHGFSYETPDEVAAATMAGIADGSLSSCAAATARRRPWR